jgi:hypothetical protein
MLADQPNEILDVEARPLIPVSEHARARTLIYVAGPFSGKGPTPEARRADTEQKIERAARLGLAVSKLGAYPVVPHSNTALPEYEDAQPYEFWIEGTAEMLRRCDAVIFTPDWRDSSGARGEEKLAAELGIPRFYTLSDLACWLLPGLAFKTGEQVPALDTHQCPPPELVGPSLDEEPLCGAPFEDGSNLHQVRPAHSLADLAKTIPTLAPERSLADAYDENEPGTSPEIPSLRPGPRPNTGV